jgi:lantibiotic biosynthesis protein
MTDDVALAEPGTRRRRGARTLYEPAGPVLVRAPVLPVEAYLGLAPDAPLDPLVRTALAVGSRDLLDQLDRKRTERGRATLLRYLIRMSTRPTPYGLFAAVGLAETGDATDLRIAGPPRTRTRPDMEWLLALVRRLEARPEVRRELRVFANPTVLVRGGRAQLAERAILGDGDRAPVGIRATGAVARVLSLARAPVPWARLAEALRDTPGATPEKVEGLLEELFEQTFLLSELRPPLTHPSPARYVAERLAGVARASAEHAALTTLLDAMRDWDEQPVAGRPDAQRTFAALTAAAVPGFDGTLAQVDAALTLGGGRLHGRIAREAARAAELLLRVSPGGGGQLDGYRNAFVGRYGVEREVPLLELLDHEHGLGAPGPGHGAGINQAKLVLRNQTLRDLALDALRERRLVVELDGATLERVATGSPAPENAPASLDVAVFVLAESAHAIDAGAFELLIGPNLGGQEAGRNFGRFGDLLGEAGIAALAEIAAGSSSDVELVYLPRRGRSANVAIRPAVHRYEIAAGTMPGVEPQFAIPLSEVLIGVRDGRFYARWPGLEGDLRVHAGHMLNPHQAPVAIRALEELGRDGWTSLNSFHWGVAADLPFLPRIQVDRIILAAAQWQIDCAIRDAHLAPSKGFPEALAAWREAWMVPRHVYLTVADNRLLLDLNAPEQADQLRHELRRLPESGVLVLQEPLPGPEHAWLAGPQGRYLTELVVPIALRAPAPSASDEERRPRRAPAVPSADERLRAPGSDWLFLKLYVARDGEEALLTSSIRGFCQFATGSALADRWFYVRYADPEPHLRLRFGGAPERLVQELFPRICEWTGELLAAGACRRVAFDTYEREIERYGGPAAMDVAETLFAADSAAAVELLRLAESELPTIDRTTLALLSVDALLAALGLDAPARLAWYRGCVGAKHRSGDDYRERRGALRRLLGDPGARLGEPGGRALERVLAARGSAVAHAAARLGELERDGRLDAPLERLCESYVHLHCNRLLGSQPPTEQHVLGLLLRTHEGLQRAPVVAADPFREEEHDGS